MSEYRTGTHPFTQSLLWLWLLLILAAHSGHADDGPFLAMSPPGMEEPGNLEIATKGVTAKPSAGNRFLGVATEFEYSVNAWWTTELTVGGETMRNDGSKQPLEPGNNSHYEFEPELILDSHYQGWTIAERLTVEKNIGHGSFGFGYAAGVSRPLALGSKSDRCTFCASNLLLGIAAEGGLGTNDDFGLQGTSQYLAGVVAWTLPNDITFRVSPGFGVTKASAPLLLRFSVSYEVDGFGQKIRNLFHSNLP